MMTLNGNELFDFKAAVVSSVRPKPLFWFRSDIEIQNGRYFQADTLTNRNYRYRKKSSYLKYRYFSIIKGPLNPNSHSNIKYFQLIFVDLCSISSFPRFISPQEKGKLDKTWKCLKRNLKNKIHKEGFGSNTDLEIEPLFRLPIPKPGFGRTLL